MSEWIPVQAAPNDSGYVPALKHIDYGAVIVTYLTGKKKKPQVKTVWVEHGRVLCKHCTPIAYMPLPEPYKGGTG